MDNHKECSCCDELRKEIEELKSAFISLNIDVRIQREYDHAREKLTAWLEATKHRVSSCNSERSFKQAAAKNTLDHLNRLYFDVPYKKGKVQIAIDAANAIIDYYEKTYGSTTSI